MKVHMKIITRALICFTIGLSALAYAEDVQLNLKNGVTWNGEIGQTISVTYKDRGKEVVHEGKITRATNSYIIIDGSFLFIDNIVSITSDATESDSSETEKTSDSNNEVPPSDADENPLLKKTAKEGDLPKGVFCLPLHEMVGTYFRDNEITQLIEHIEENYGLGQIIVLEIHSGGGAVHIWDKIREAIFEARDRHRFIAWIESAGSGAAATAFLCDEIYYRSYGYVGAITMYSGDIENVAPDWQMDGWVKELESVLAKTSHTPMIAGSMVRSKYNFSYDVDPETGEFTYYNHEFGDHVLSKTGRNMMLSPEEAVQCGMSDGTADDGEELAKFLDLEEWVEIDSYGRDIAKKWTKTLKEFELLFPELMAQFGGNVQADTEKKALSERIAAGKKLLQWHKKIGEDTWPMVANGASVEAIKREIKNLEFQKKILED
ncbi:MAG: hypothetical protein ISR75_05775 [Phycisphaerales bacterium]|nr:hypothetical protein [Phycisphaerales bacterium]